MDYKVKDRSRKVEKRRNWRADNRRSIQLQMASIAKSAKGSADKNHGKFGHLCSTLCGASMLAGNL